MADLITNADLGIGAPGASAYERAVLGLPSIHLMVADNQRGIARMMGEARAALDVGMIDDGFRGRLRPAVEHLLHDSRARVQVARAASELVQGRGAALIAEALG